MVITSHNLYNLYTDIQACKCNYKQCNIYALSPAHLETIIGLLYYIYLYFCTCNFSLFTFIFYLFLSYLYLLLTLCSYTLYLNLCTYCLNSLYIRRLFRTLCMIDKCNVNTRPPRTRDHTGRCSDGYLYTHFSHAITSALFK